MKTTIVILDSDGMPWSYVLDVQGENVQFVKREPISIPRGAAIDNANRKKKCCAPVIVRWLGMRWYGTPWPVRIWRWIRYRHSMKGYRGCGCIVKLKILFDSLRMAMFMVRRA